MHLKKKNKLKNKHTGETNQLLTAQVKVEKKWLWAVIDNVVKTCT